MSSSDNGGVRVNMKLLIPTVVAVMLVSLPMVYYANHPAMQTFIDHVYSFTANSFGWTYVLLFLVFCFISVFFAFSPYGNIKLGGKNAKPAFGTFYWASMIIAAGHGIGMINWVMVEPLVTNHIAPAGTGPNQAFTYEVAAAYTFFHWGPFYWVLYLVACIPIFYFLGVRQMDKQCVSSTVAPLLEKCKSKEIWNILFDVFIILGLAGGLGATLAIAVRLVAGLFAETMGITPGTWLDVIALGVFTVVTLGSLLRPVSRGMQVLSTANSILAIILLLVVVVGGPTAFFFSLGTNTLGMVMDMLPRVAGWTDPFQAVGYPQDWTIFYGAWIYAYAPMMGIFFTGISIGRTLRQTILGVMFFGCVSSFLFCIIFGGYTLYMQYEGIFDLYSYYIATEKSLFLTVSKVLSFMPGAKFFAPAFLVMCTIFLTTTIDAATRVLASMTTKSLHAGEEPAISSKIIWCLSLSFLVLALLLVGGLPVIQALVVLAAIPLVGLGIAMNISMWKAMNKDFPSIRQKGIRYYSPEEGRGAGEPLPPE